VIRQIDPAQQSDGSRFFPQKLFALNSVRDNVSSFPVSQNRHWQNYFPYADENEAWLIAGVHVD
jgi:hypothetical protein